MGSGFRELVGQVCALAHAPAAASCEVVHLDIHGIRFILMDGRMVEEGSMIFLCDFGVIPAQARTRVLQRLLEANLVMLGMGTPCFTVDYENDHVLLMGRVNIATTSACVLYNAFVQHAQRARRWRMTHFLLEHERNAGEPVRRQHLSLVAGTALNRS